MSLLGGKNEGVRKVGKDCDGKSPTWDIEWMALYECFHLANVRDDVCR
jgi:hypothetical protein